MPSVGVPAPLLLPLLWNILQGLVLVQPDVGCPSLELTARVRMCRFEEIQASPTPVGVGQAA